MGKVYLVGAGPGAVDLITVRGAAVLARAEVVLYDALIEPEMLQLAPHARCVAVGKRCGKQSSAQHFINKQLLEAARTHAVVVRLKGGDPMLFGRADEEMRALESANIEYEIVPGITAALASAASVRHSLTLRGVARSVAFLTQRQADGAEAIRQRADADSLVIYMGRNACVSIARELLVAGRSPATPLIIIEACSTPRERQLRLTLGQMAAGFALPWFDETQPSLLMLGEAFAARCRDASRSEAA